MKIHIIGQGNMATQLHSAFKGAHCDVFLINSRADLIEAADVNIIAVADDAIELVMNKASEPSGIWLHTSGQKSMDILSKAEYHGILYPLQTIRKEQEVDWSSVPILIEMNHEEVLPTLFELGNRISNRVEEVSEQDRKTLHLAAVWTNNFTNSVLAEAQQIVQSKDLDISLLQPLLEATVANGFKNDLVENQTGPAKRNDAKTMQMHVAQLEQIKSVKAYNALSELIQQQQYGAIHKK